MVHKLPHGSKTVTVMCSDGRLYEKRVLEIIRDNFGLDMTPDVVALPGASKSIADGNAKWLEVILEATELLVKAHQSTHIFPTVHTDCAAYGEDGHRERITKDLQQMADLLKERFPNVEIIPLLVRLEGGTVETEPWFVAVDEIKQAA